MRTRDKVIIVLILGTLALGAMIAYSMRDSSVDAGYMRWALSNKIHLFLASPKEYLFGDSAGSSPMVYIGIGVFGLLFAVLAFNFFGDSESQLMRKRLKELDAAKNEAESALQEQVRKGKTDRHARDTAMKDLESSIDKIEILLGELGEKERMLKVRESELVTLKTDPSGRPGVVAARSKPADRMLGEELRKKTEALQARDAALKDLEQRLGAKTAQWENQLREKERQVKGRESELEGLRFQINDLNEQLSDMEAARKRADERLQDESRRRRELIEANEAASKAEEQRLSELVHALELQLTERDKILKVRDSDLAGFRRHLDELAGAKEQAENSLKEQLGQKDQAQQAKEAAVKELEQRFGAMLQALRIEVGEKNLLLETRDGEVQALSAEVGAVAARLSETEAAHERAQATLQEELRKAQQRASSDVTVRELEERHGRELDSAAQQLREKEVALQARLGELAALQSEVQAVSGRLNETLSAKERVEASLQEELRKEHQQREAREAANRELEERYGAEVANAANLAKQLREKEEAVQVRDGELTALQSEVKSMVGRLNDTVSAKERAEASLQEELRKERQQREARESANRELAERYGGEVANLAQQLREKEEAVQVRDGELTALQSEVKSIASRLNDTVVAKESAEASLQEELRKERQQREARENANRELEEGYTRELHSVAAQLDEKEQFLQSRDGEVQTLKTQLASLVEQFSKVESAKERAATLLQEKIRNDKQLREANDSALKELEENFKAKIAVLEQQLSEKLQTMGSRDSQVQALTTELSALNRRLSDTEAAKEKAESLFNEAIREKADIGASKDAARRELEDDLTNRIRAIEAQLKEREELLKSRDSDLLAVKKQIADLGASKEQIARTLQEEIRRKGEELAEREAAAQASEERFSERLRTLESELNERREQLTGREKELAGLSAKVGSLTSQLTDVGALKDQTMRALQEEIRRKGEELGEREAAAKALEERFSERLRTLENELDERREQLAGREKELASLSAKVGSLTSQLTDDGATKDQATRTLQEEIRRKGEELAEREAAAQASEERFSERLRALESELSERREQLAEREKELAGLSAKVGSLTNQLANTGSSNDEVARALEQELQEKSELLQAKEAAVKSLENRLSGTVRSLEGELGAKDELLQNRDQELDALMSKVSALAGQVADLESARARAERQLQEEARERNALLESNKAELDDLEERLAGRVKTLERQLTDKQKLLETGSTEIGDLRAQMSVLEERLKESESAKTWLEGALEQARNADSRELLVSETDRLPLMLGAEAEDGEADGLDSIRTEREELLKARDKLINDLMGELKEKKTQLAKHEIEVWQGIERRGVWKHRLSKIGIRLKD